MADAVRFSPAVSGSLELRTAGNGNPVLEGYASTFNQPYDLGPYMEQVDPEAFNRTLAGKPDVRLLIDHKGQPLARTKSGTLDLGTDSTGLHMRAELDPSDPDVQRLLPKMRRGDLDQMSFAFRVPDGGREWNEDRSLVTLRELNLAGGDVSVVTYPANPNAMVTLRSEDVAEAEVVFLHQIVDDFRSGRPITAANVKKFRSLLVDLHTDEVEEATEVLEEIEATQTTDEATEPVVEPAGFPLGLAAAQAAALDL